MQLNSSLKTLYNCVFSLFCCKKAYPTGFNTARQGKSPVLMLEQSMICPTFRPSLSGPFFSGPFFCGPESRSKLGKCRNETYRIIQIQNMPNKQFIYEFYPHDVGHYRKMALRVFFKYLYQLFLHCRRFTLKMNQMFNMVQGGFELETPVRTDNILTTRPMGGH